MRYESEDSRVVEFLWNSRDGVTPFIITAKDGKTELRHVRWQSDECRPSHLLQPGDRYFADLTREAAQAYAAERMRMAEGTKYELQGEECTRMEALIAEEMLKQETPDILTFTA